MRRINVDNMDYQVQKIAKFDPHSETFCHVCCKTLSVYNFKLTLMEKLTIARINNISKSFNFTVIGSTLDTCDMVRVKEMSKNAFQIDLTLKIIQSTVKKGNFIWKLSAFNKVVSFDGNSAIPNVLDEKNIIEFFQKAKQLSICTGNNDLPKLMSKKKEERDSSSLSRNVLETAITCIKFNDIETSLRHKECLTLISRTGRCSKCQSSRHSLQKMERRQSEVDEPPPNSLMTKNQLHLKVQKLSKENCVLKKKQRQLEQKIDNLVRKEGFKVQDQGTSEVINDIISKECPFDKTSVMALLWVQQQKAFKLNCTQSMKWHPVIIRWCLSIYLRSPGNCIIYSF